MEAYLRTVKEQGLPLNEEQKKLIAELEAQEAGDTSTVNMWSTATASHILLKGNDAHARATALLAEINAGTRDFGDAAKALSECPSGGRARGSLGSFGPGKMVPAFDKVVFDPTTELGKLQLVETDFGTHILRVDERSGVQSSEGGWKKEPVTEAAATQDTEIAPPSFPASLEDDGYEPGCGWTESCEVDADDGADEPVGHTEQSPRQATPASSTGATANELWGLRVQERERAACLLEKKARGDTLDVNEALELRNGLATLVQALERERAEQLLEKKVRGDKLNKDEALELRAGLATLVHTLSL